MVEASPPDDEQCDSCLTVPEYLAKLEAQKDFLPLSTL